MFPHGDGKYKYWLVKEKKSKRINHKSLSIRDVCVCVNVFINNRLMNALNKCIKIVELNCAECDYPQYFDSAINAPPVIQNRYQNILGASPF